MGADRMAAKKKRKYHLKPEAKRRYLRLLWCLGGVLVLCLLLRLTVFRSTYTLGDFDPKQPFNVASQVMEVIDPKKDEDLVIVDVFINTDNKSTLTSVQVQLTELISQKKCREWTLDIGKSKARLTKGETLKANLSSQRGRFPPLEESLSTLSRIPFLTIATSTDASSKEHYEYNTKSYRPNVNPSFSDHAQESGASVIWVSRTGAVSNSDPTYIPISDYMAIDCYSAMNDGSGEPRHRFVILLER